MDISSQGSEKKFEIGKDEPVIDPDTNKTVMAKACEAYREDFISQMVRFLNGLARGDLSFTPVLKPGDQYTIVLHDQYVPIFDSMEETIRSIKGLIGDAEMLSRSAVEGKLSTRANVAVHKGDYQKVIKGMNDTLDAIVGPITVTSDYVSKFAKGEIPAKVTVEYRGDFNNIKRDLNACIDSLDGLAKAGAVLKGMAENDYSVTVKGTFPGVYGEIATSVNLVEDRILHIEHTVTSISNGDLSELSEYKNIGNGRGRRSDQDELVPSMIRLMESLKALVLDTEMLAKAGIEGRLGTRADASKHKGEYRKVVQDINNTLDAVITPLNEAMRVADAYASGDLTARVSIDTQGDFTRFANSLDRIGDSLVELLKQVNSSIDLVSATSQELASSAEEMNASTEQVSAAIQQISRGAQDQATQVEETAKLMASMSTSVNEATEYTGISSKGAATASGKADAGKIAVESTINKMQEIQKVVDESAKVIAVLGKRSEEIGEIVDVITNISDQTNLLALNAAIEAARAGEQGRGFAVVAEEVKNLAEDSREAAERIAKMIKEVQQETGKAVEAMERGTKTAAEGMNVVTNAGESFIEIAKLTGSFSDSMQKLSKIMDEQKDHAQMAAKSVDGISAISEETASASEESASSTEELTASMEDMTARAQSLAEMAISLKKVAGAFNIGEDVSPAGVAASVPKPQPVAKVIIKKATGTASMKVPSKVQEALSKRGVKTTSG
jgi:methyl-accepting chemotaxis protein